MKLHRFKSMLAAAGSFVILINSRWVIPAYADMPVNGEIPIITDANQCRRLLMELVSGAEKGVRQEYELVGKDYVPETLVIAQMFPDAVNISNTKMASYREGGHQYVTCRIGFERKDAGSKDAEPSQDDVLAGDAEGIHWKVGDCVRLPLGGETYVFRCIDEEYEYDSEYRTGALFLCETVIRSDIDSTETMREILPFGGNSNYRTSSVRAWMQEKLGDDAERLLSADTGVDSAYLGATVPGTYEAFAEQGLLRQELTDQALEDRLFLLSMEEAIRYRDELWDVEGGGTPYSRGYWLRTPAYSVDEAGNFSYGNWVYEVDLERGCICPAAVEDGSVGIRPAFCLPQA